jgi:hypothetical protein
VQRAFGLLQGLRDCEGGDLSSQIALCCASSYLIGQQNAVRGPLSGDPPILTGATSRFARSDYVQVNWVKVFGNANHQTKTIFKDRLKIRSTPSFIVFKDGEVQ